MALSGIVGTKNYNTRYQYCLSWSATQNIANNTSTITVSWVFKKIARDPYNAFNKAGTSKVNLNIGGVESGYSRADFDLRSAAVGATQVLKSYTRTVTHNADGTLSLSLSGTHITDITWGTVSTSGTITLDTIPRASKPTITGTLELGNEVTINTNRASENFTHTIKYSWGSYASGTIASNVGASTTWTIPKSLANGIPNGTSGTLNITVETYSGTTLIGTTTTSFAVSVPNTSEFKPTVSNITLSEAVSGLNAKFGGFVTGKSKISGSVSASGAYSSTIKSYSVSINGQTYASSTFTTDFLLGSGTCTVTVTDSRGRQASLSKTYTCLDYENPKITTFTVERCNSDGTLNDEGSYAKCTINASISSVNNKNNKSFLLQYKKQTGTTYTDVTISNLNYTFNGTQIIASIDVDSEYDFKLTVTDYFTSVEKSIELNTGFTLINFGNSGRSLAFGKVSTKESGFEINMPMYDSEDMIIRGYPVDSIYISVSSTNPSSILGGQWEAYGTLQSNTTLYMWRRVS